jgi:hypothetical protein
MTTTVKRRTALVALCFVALVMLASVASAQELFILKGDLHCHSSYSHDSEVPVDKVIADSIVAGYDFIALTEHNTVSHLAEDHSTEDLLVISGYEHTTPAAHVNIFGLRFVPRKTTIYDGEQMESYLAPLREQGALLQLNHPNADLYYSRFGYDLDFHFLEIINGVFRDDDRKTLADYQTLLVEGRKLVATGGSDAHKDHAIRKTFNNVLVSERSETAILEGLRLGRNFVTVQVDGPIISLTSGDTIMGGTVVYEPGQTIDIAIDRLVPGTIIKVYTSGGLVHTERFASSEVGSWRKQWPTEGISFCRVELWFNEADICAISNPIYVQQ